MPTTFGGWRAPSFAGASVIYIACQMSPVCTCCSACSKHRLECRSIRIPAIIDPITRKEIKPIRSLRVCAYACKD